MGKGRCRKDRNVRLAVFLAQGACHEENKQYFDKFTGLEGHSGNSEADLGAVRNRAQQQYRAQRRDSQDPVKISSLTQRVELAAQERDHHEKYHAGKRDQKLFLRLGLVDPCDHDQSDAQEHHDIVDHEHIGAFIESPVEQRCPKDDQKLQNAECKDILVSGKDRHSEICVDRKDSEAQPLQSLTGAPHVFSRRQSHIGEKCVKNHGGRDHIFTV